MENQRSHKYYCTRCDRYLYGESLTHLATAANYHATAYHPSDFAQWTAEGITHSTQYEGATGPLPEYVVPYANVEQRALTITEDDRAMLQRAGVGW